MQIYFTAKESELATIGFIKDHKQELEKKNNL